MTLAIIRARCEEVGDCWIWQRATCATGYPIMTIARRCHLVRRIAVEASGRALKPRQPVGSRCGDKLCVNPDHLFPSTTAAIARKAARAGAFSAPTRGAKIAQARRGTMKLTQEQVREIRASTESGPALALRYGVNRSLVQRIRSGNAWRDYASPFAGLLAANEGRKRA